MPETKRVRRVASKPEESASTQPAPVEVAAAATPAPAPAAAAAAAAPAKQQRVKKEAAPAAAVAAPVEVVATPVESGNERVEGDATVAAAAPVSEVEALATRLTAELEAFRAYKQTLGDLAKEMSSRMESLVKDAQRVLKKAGKGRRRKAAEGATSTRKPTGFHSPMSVTEELCAFLNKPNGTKFSRTDVTKEINSYIRANNLLNPDDKREIVPDAPLRTLLRLSSDQKLTYFNLQKAFNHLFVKKEEATA
jgi:uncharacterized cupredoxin-like copper-binding protein